MNCVPAVDRDRVVCPKRVAAKCKGARDSRFTGFRECAESNDPADSPHSARVQNLASEKMQSHRQRRVRVSVANKIRADVRQGESGDFALAWIEAEFPRSNQIHPAIAVRGISVSANVAVIVLPDLEVGRDRDSRASDAPGLGSRGKRHPPFLGNWIHVQSELTKLRIRSARSRRLTRVAGITGGSA